MFLGLVAYVAYLGDLFWPVGLAVLYPHPGLSLSTWEIMAASLALLGISIGAIVGWRRYPYFIVGWLWYLGMLLPVIGLVQLAWHARADRYTYLPQIGLYLALVWGAAKLSQRWPSRRWVWRARRS